MKTNQEIVVCVLAAVAIGVAVVFSVSAFVLRLHFVEKLDDVAANQTVLATIDTNILGTTVTSQGELQEFRLCEISTEGYGSGTCNFFGRDVGTPSSTQLMYYLGVPTSDHGGDSGEPEFIIGSGQNVQRRKDRKTGEYLYFVYARKILINKTVGAESYIWVAVTDW